MPIHPAAEAFPRMSESDFRTLAQDVKERGLNVPVVLLRSLKHGTTLLLDGISRLDALDRAERRLFECHQTSNTRSWAKLGRSACN